MASSRRGKYSSAYASARTILLLALAFFLSSCQPDLLPTFFPSATLTVTAAPKLEETLFPPSQPLLEEVETTRPGPQVLTIWLPPQFDPANGSPAGARLQQRLTDFVAANPGVEIRVRVKAPDGPSGLLESLSTAAAAAPAVLPSLILLSRSDLETASLKGLVFPLDPITQAMDQFEWYEYARQLATVGDEVFGLPLAGDVLVILYRPEKAGQIPVTDWASIFDRGQPVIFPAADSLASVTLNLYLSAGGQIGEDQNHPVLQSEVLANVLSLYADGARQGCFPSWLAQYQTDGQAWQAYSEQRGHWVITWTARYLSERPADSKVARLPPLGKQPVALTTGWIWAVSDPNPERRALAANLARYLVETEFMGQWSAEAGYLPTRPSALRMWNDQNLQGLLSQIIETARIYPTKRLMDRLGPVLQEATLQVIKNQNDPVQAAEAAVESLNTIEFK